jgi:hypothetical protein
MTSLMGWPDVIVAAIMGRLGLWGGWQIVAHARDELRSESAHHAIVAGTSRIKPMKHETDVAHSR